MDHLHLGLPCGSGLIARAFICIAEGALSRADPMAADRVFPIHQTVKKNRFGEALFEAANARLQGKPASARSGDSRFQYCATAYGGLEE